MSSKKLRLTIQDDGKLSVTSSSQIEASEEGEDEMKRKIRLGGNVVCSTDGKLHFDVENRFEEYDVFFKDFLEKIISLGLTNKNTDLIVGLSKNLIETHTNLVLKLFQSSKNENFVEIIKETSDHVNEQFKNISTNAKRVKEFRKNPLYVEPKEISLALKWRSKAFADHDLPSHRLVPSTCQFVSIKNTLQAIFSEQEFQSVYLAHNSKETHECQIGVYENFCCGSTYKTKDIFQDPNVVQIQLGMDDFEVCSPVKSKATKHTYLIKSETYLRIYVPKSTISTWLH